MTNNEHNDKIFLEIDKKQREIEELKSKLLPADAVAEVDLTVCNANMVADRFAEFERKSEVTAAINEVLSPAIKAKRAKK